MCRVGSNIDHVFRKDHKRGIPLKGVYEVPLPVHFLGGDLKTVAFVDL